MAIYYRSINADNQSWTQYHDGDWVGVSENTYVGVVFVERPITGFDSEARQELNTCAVLNQPEPPHSDRLPTNVQWRGTYLPGVRRSTYDNGVYITSTTAYACPHCALEHAKTIRAANPSLQPGQTASLFVVTTQENGVLPTGWVLPTQASRLLPETAGGPLNISCNTEKTVSLGYGCKTCGFPGHNTRTCTTTKHYDKVGIEIEGRFIALSMLLRQAEEDGVGSCDDCSVDRGASNARAREFQTKPGSLIDALRQLVKYYPDETDATCGMHVHVSFLDDTSISQLITQEFYDYFRNRWVAWAGAQGLGPASTFMRRLMGENDYCNVNHSSPNENPFGCERYRQLNFTAWSEHKTVECRLLPMFKSAKLGVAAVVHLLQIFEDWLARDSAVLPLPSTPVDQASVTPMILGTQYSAVREMEVSEAGFIEIKDHPQLLEIAELPPVPEGHRRVVVHGSQIDILRNMGLVA